LCKTYGISCPEPEPSPSSEKFFLATFLQYVSKDAQIEIYEPNMGSEDSTRLRVQNDDELNSEYVQAAQSLPGEHGVAFKSSNCRKCKASKGLGI
jgi:hypothetical protein